MTSQAEMERAVIGALLRDRGQGWTMFDRADFSGIMKSAYEAIAELTADGPWDLARWNLRAERIPFSLVDWGNALSSACAPQNLPAYAAMLRRQRQLREIRRHALTLAEQANGSADPAELAKAALDRFAGIEGPRQPLDGMRSLAEIMAEHELTGAAPRVRTGLPSLDEHAHIEAGTLNVIAARPGGGKSAMMLDWSVQAARSGWQVLMFSLEMSLKDIRRRLWTMFPSGPGEVANLALWIQEPPSRRAPVGHVTAMAAEFCRMLRDRPTLIVVDYVQILAPNRYWQTRREQVGEVVRELKALAMSLEVPVLIGAQLSRAVEQRGPNAFPIMADLKEAGEIEEVADLVCLLHRNPSKHESMLGVGKNRHGIGHYSFPLTFLSTARFAEREPDWREAP